MHAHNVAPLWLFASIFANGKANQARPTNCLSLSIFPKPRLLRTYTFPPLRGGNSKEDAVEARIGELEAEIQEVNVEIKSTIAKIESAVFEIACVVQSSAQNPVGLEYFRDRDKQQRVHLDKKKQLHHKKSSFSKKKLGSTLE